MAVTRAARLSAALSVLATVGFLTFPGTAVAQPDLDCGDFQFPEVAQEVLDRGVGDPHRLDDDGDGIACELLPRRGTSSPSPEPSPDPEPEPSPEPSPDPVDTSARFLPTTSAQENRDRDCPDFASQADAQAALEADPSDPERLDADDDGIACESHFGSDNQQVQVHPVGGVDTGGRPSRA
ncbi:excalibur calcium-binding domain-containing protein [Pseudonocardia bannensis]|uniref:Excalibur calcium-binding domain-containing protein n=1 Tax=Pseudonocardia bannensis TaxID=630973 RepID=A0A848DBJ1_9PSEU|nr:excalibur calcium-binding domain-containing protein [Pseudonocardia bannensis]NMH90107.1 hypothetical protein [Pseudonocardia bannensis]